MIPLIPLAACLAAFAVEETGVSDDEGRRISAKIRTSLLSGDWSWFEELSRSTYPHPPPRLALDIARRFAAWWFERFSTAPDRSQWIEVYTKVPGAMGWRILERIVAWVDEDGEDLERAWAMREFSLADHVIGDDLDKHSIQLERIYYHYDIVDYARKFKKAPPSLRVEASTDPNSSYRYAKEVDRHRPHPITRQGVLGSPFLALQYAEEVDKAPRDDTRATACREPKMAVQYAIHVDRVPRDDTRAAACQDPQDAAQYAAEVDQIMRPDTRGAALMDPSGAYKYARFEGPRDDTRAIAMQVSHLAVDYAVYVDGGPRDDTRAAACQVPYCAVGYARRVDFGPREDTRAAACAGSQPVAAYEYALYLDNGPRDDTRAAAILQDQYAFRYAVNVDKAFRPDTWAAVKGTPYERKYREALGGPRSKR